MKAAMGRGLALVALALVCAALAGARPASAQGAQCRRSCSVGETRDDNGCCVAARVVTPTATNTPPAHVRVSCPAGSTWSEAERRCLRPVTLTLHCPEGTHLDNDECVAEVVGCPQGSHSDGASGRCVGDVSCPTGTELREGHCVAQVVCPSGTRLEGGSCVAAVSCPTGTRLDGNACVAPLTCPEGASMEQNRCVSREVQCPSGTVRTGRRGACVGEPVCPSGTAFSEGRGCVASATCPPGTLYSEGRGCVGASVCPEGTRFVEGRGCEGSVLCPRGTHRQDAACVPDANCVDGEVFAEGRGCVSACAAISSSHWVSERAACVCDTGYTTRAGHCEMITACPEGFRLDRGVCVVDVVCPQDYRYLRRVGCVPMLEHPELLNESERRQRDRIRWAGPALALWAGGGGFVAGGEERRYAPWSVTGGLTYSAATVLLGVNYTYAPESVGTRQPIWNDCTQLNGTPTQCRHAMPMHLAQIEFGAQVVTGFHSARFSLHLGLDLAPPILGASALPNPVIGAAYRSVFRLVAGLFLAAEVRGFVHMDVNEAVSFGLAGYGLIGYSIY